MKHTTYEIGDRVWYKKDEIYEGEITDFVRVKNPAGEMEYYALLDSELDRCKPVKQLYQTKKECETAVIEEKTAELGLKIGDNVCFNSSAIGHAEHGKIYKFIIFQGDVYAEIDNGFSKCARTINIGKLVPFEEITSAETLSKFIWKNIVKRSHDDDTDSCRIYRWAVEYAQEKAKEYGIALK